MPTATRRAPVQGETHDLDGRRFRPALPPGSIAWAEHLEAYAVYARRYGTGQTAERLAERGGFGWHELADLLGHGPYTWEPRS